MVRNKINAEMSGTNNPTCLLNSIAKLLPGNNKELMYVAMTSSMRAEGITSISNIASTLAAHGMMLKKVNEKCIQKGGAAFHLL